MTISICGRENCGDNTCLNVYFFTPVDCPAHCCVCDNLACSNMCFYTNCDGCCVGCGECGECTAAGASAEVALFLFIILAFLGLVVSVFAGFIFVQQVVGRHISIVRKQGLAQDYIVADLAANDIEVNNSSNNTLPDLSRAINNPLLRNNNRGYEVINSSAPEFEMMERDSPQARVPSAPLLSVSQQRELSSLGLI